MNQEPTWIGRTIGGRYQIESLLGQGGMSAVYKAVDPNLRRAVAVKIIHPHLSGDRDFVRRFEEEAAAVAQLRHPNIIQVHDFNHECHTYYIVFEYIPGESLQAWLKRLNEANRQMDFEEATRIAASVGDALGFAHEQGLIHRDIKPANIMINVRGQPILMDFGIAKIMGGTQHTATGAVLGTARYMSPEQIRGQQIDARTDIYSLGVTLFEMVSGRPPFAADSAMTMMMMHVQDPVPDLTQLRPNVPPQLKMAINTALEKEPENRFRTAAKFVAALNRTSLDAPAAIPPSAELPESEAPETVVAPTLAAPTDKPWRKWLLTGGGLAAVIALIFFTIFQLTNSNDGATPKVMMTQAGMGPVTQEMEESATEAVETAVPPPTPTEIAALAEAAVTTAAPAINTPLPTATPLPSVRINAITIENGFYMVDFVTIGYRPNIEGQHMHFYYNTVAPENAGRPGTGPYTMFANTSPFFDFSVAERPEGATQLCVVVANGDHTIQFESGNCMDLPEPPTPTPLPAPAATSAPRVQISSVTEENGRYIINFQTFGYTPILPGMHVHFFFNTVALENAGSPGSGPWKLYSGPSPFTEYLVSDQPDRATQMCSLVANSDHSVQPGTGNCVNLP